MEKGSYTRRCGFSGSKRYLYYVESLKNHNNAVDVTFYDAINVYGNRSYPLKIGLLTQCVEHQGDGTTLFVLLIKMNWARYPKMVFTHRRG